MTDTHVVYVIAASHTEYEDYLRVNAIAVGKARHVHEPDQLRGLSDADIRVASWPIAGSPEEWRANLTLADRKWER